MIEWWIAAVIVALLCALGSWTGLEEEGVQPVLAVPLASALGLVCGAGVLAIGGVI